MKTQNGEDDDVPIVKTHRESYIRSEMLGKYWPGLNVRQGDVTQTGVGIDLPAESLQFQAQILLQHLPELDHTLAELQQGRDQNSEVGEEPVTRGKSGQANQGTEQHSAEEDIPKQHWVLVFVQAAIHLPHTVNDHLQRVTRGIWIEQ